jgi:hypothetical protein
VGLPHPGSGRRALLLDPLSKAQQMQLRDIGRRITNAVGAEDTCPDQ